MTTTVPLLAARALRKIGVTMVADANRPTPLPTQTAADVADDMLRQMGIVIAEGNRPGAVGTVTQADIAARALRNVGINPAAAPLTAPSVPVQAAVVAAIMLIRMGIPTAQANQSPLGAVVPAADIAARALRAVGINPAVITPGIGTGLTHATSDVATAALLKLAVIASDETASATDTAYALNAANEVHDLLVANDYVTWPAGAIPHAAFEYYVIMAANIIGSAFGKAASAEGFAQAQGLIRILALSGPNGQALAMDKVTATHGELNALALVSWSINSIPASEAEHYVTLTALALSPVYRPMPADDVKTAAQIREATIEAVRHAAMLLGVEARAANRVGVVHAELVGLGFVTWGINNIPAALVDLYAVLAESMMTAEGGKPLSVAEYAARVMEIRMIVLSGPLGQSLAEAKVAATHEELNALALVSWGLGAVPTGYAEYYVDLTSSKLAPIYKPDTDRKANIEADAVVLAAMKRAGFVSGALARAVDRVRVVHEELNAIGLVSWDIGSIPLSASDAYMAMASSKMQAEGGLPLTNPEYASWQQRVRMIAMGGAAGQALAEQKIRAVHFDLEARGRVRWTIWDLPSFAEEPYVLKAAVLLAPECFVKVDPTWDIQAERDLMRIVSLPSGGEPVIADYF